LVIGTREIRVVSVEMRSPLEIVVHIPGDVIKGGLAFGLLALGQRIRTLGPRVSRKRKQDLLMAAVYEKARSDIVAGRADGLAVELLRGDNALRPERLDILDAETLDSDELEEVRLPSGGQTTPADEG